MYGHVWATRHIDYLCHPEDTRLAGSLLSQLGYKSYAEPWAFRDSGITLHRHMKPAGEGEWFHVVDLLVPPAGRLYWIAEAEHVQWGEMASVSVVSRGHLIEMKKLRGSITDQSDISKLEEEA